MMESDSLNSISWVSSPSKIPWKFHFYFNNIPWRFHFYFNKILSLSSLLDVAFKHVRCYTNGFVESLAKQGCQISKKKIKKITKKRRKKKYCSGRCTPSLGLTLY